MALPDGFRLINLTSGDVKTIQALLKSNDLPSEDCGDHLSNFIGIAQGDQINKQIIAVAGYERIAQFALLRSVAVDSQFRRQGLAASLIENRLDQLRLLKVAAVYILTETAEQYFGPLGFERVDRDRLPSEIQSTQQCQTLCPASAIAMRLVL